MWGRNIHTDPVSTPLPNRFPYKKGRVSNQSWMNIKLDALVPQSDKMNHIGPVSTVFVKGNENDPKKTAGLKQDQMIVK